MRLVALTLTLLLPSVASPQGPDSARVPSLPTVVTAERAPTSLSGSVSSVTRLPSAELARMPRATVADLLRLAPGIAVIDLDGLGFDPQLIVRGFYGGGEAEYVALLVDGRPVNQLQSGLVAWDVLPPLAAIDAIEIVRGSASPLYGDAAIGGVINVITRSIEAPRPLRWGASGGGLGTARADIDAVVAPTWGSLALSGGVDRTSGFRDHAARTSGRARVRYGFGDWPNGGIAVTAHSHWREFEEPGPLLASLMAQDREGSDPIFRYDETTDQNHGLTLDGRRRLGARTTFSGTLGGELRNTDATRTLPLAPGFGDTKRRDLSTGRFAADLQFDVADSPLPGADLLIVGAEANYGSLESRYYRIASGTRSDYEAGTLQDGGLDTHWDGDRLTAAVYTQYTVMPSEALRIAIGARFDHLSDGFDPVTPSGIEAEDGSHSAFSPRAGVNLRYWSDGRGSGHAYASVSRSFKAPTLDQLYDLRNIPVPFPPFEIRTSNPDLDPQHGTSYELGLYHDADLPGALRASASISVYQIDMKDELDIDLASFRYVNIGRSRHRGIEAGTTLTGSAASAFVTYTLQDVIARSGDYEGNRLKAIPRHGLSAGTTITPLPALETSLLVTHLRDVFLDDENTVELPDFTRVDLRAVLRIGRIRVFGDVRNLLDEEYASTGFLDPSEPDPAARQKYFHPAAGRVFEIGVRHGW